MRVSSCNLPLRSRISRAMNRDIILLYLLTLALHSIAKIAAESSSILVSNRLTLVAAGIYFDPGCCFVPSLASFTAAAESATEVAMRVVVDIDQSYCGSDCEEPNHYRRQILLPERKSCLSRRKCCSLGFSAMSFTAVEEGLSLRKTSRQTNGLIEVIDRSEGG